MKIVYELEKYPAQLLPPILTTLSPSSVPNGKKIGGSELSVRLSQRSNHNSNSSNNNGKYVFIFVACDLHTSRLTTEKHIRVVVQLRTVHASSVTLNKERAEITS